MPFVSAVSCKLLSIFCHTSISGSFHAHNDVGQIVQRIKDPEDVHSMLHCLVTEPRRKDLIITNDQGMQIAESI
jgi:hypothetical protein